MSWVVYDVNNFKPIIQEIVDPRCGDCMQACVASLLGLEKPSDVPHFFDVPGSTKVAPGYQWLSDKNLWFEYSHPRLSRAAGDEIDVNPEPFPGYAIASVPSALFPGTFHAVIVKDGKVVWDPSPHASKRTLPYDPVNVYYRLVSTKE